MSSQCGCRIVSEACWMRKIKLSTRPKPTKQKHGVDRMKDNPPERTDSQNSNRPSYLQNNRQTHTSTGPARREAITPPSINKVQPRNMCQTKYITYLHLNILPKGHTYMDSWGHGIDVCSGGSVSNVVQGRFRSL